MGVGCYGGGAVFSNRKIHFFDYEGGGHLGCGVGVPCASSNPALPPPIMLFLLSFSGFPNPSQSFPCSLLRAFPCGFFFVFRIGWVAEICVTGLFITFCNTLIGVCDIPVGVAVDPKALEEVCAAISEAGGTVKVLKEREAPTDEPAPQTFVNSFNDLIQRQGIASVFWGTEQPQHWYFFAIISTSCGVVRQVVVFFSPISLH